MSNVLLGVNIDHIASLRETRPNICSPNIMQALFIAEQSGADYITVHLREDRRHIKENDLKLLCQNKQTKINLEMSMNEEIIKIACNNKPEMCCIVPENRREVTTERGIDAIKNFRNLSKTIKKLSIHGIKVSVFVDAIKEQIDAVLQAGASCVEIHTGPYSRANNDSELIKEVIKIKDISKYAFNLGLQVNAGHGINYHNVKRIATIKYISDLNIGYSIISRSVFVGLSQAIKEMKSLIIES